jgi:hypothetical protein
MQIKINMKALFWTARSMAKEYITIAVVESIKENGFMIKNTDTELFNMLTEINMKVTGKMDSDVARVSMTTLTAMCMRANGLLIWNKVKED